MIEKIVKVGLGLLLLLCLFNMSYGYYQFVRFTSMIAFGFLAFNANERNNQTEKTIYIILAILFQPIFKIPLGRTLWNIVDLIVGVGLIFNALNRDDLKHLLGRSSSLTTSERQFVENLIEKSFINQVDEKFKNKLKETSLNEILIEINNCSHANKIVFSIPNNSYIQIDNSNKKEEVNGIIDNYTQKIINKYSILMR